MSQSKLGKVEQLSFLHIFQQTQYLILIQFIVMLTKQGKFLESFIASNQDDDKKEEIFQNILKNNSNKQFYQWLNIRDLMAQKKFKELIQSKMLSNIFLPTLIEDFYDIVNEIQDDIDNQNVIEYFDKLSLNGPSIRLFEIVKSFLINLFKK